MLVWCTNRSAPPSVGVMKPKPFSTLNHLTLPAVTASAIDAAMPRTAERPNDVDADDANDARMAVMEERANAAVPHPPASSHVSHTRARTDPCAYRHGRRWKLPSPRAIWDECGFSARFSHTCLRPTHLTCCTTVPPSSAAARSARHCCDTAAIGVPGLQPWSAHRSPTYPAPRSRTSPGRPYHHTPPLRT